MSRRIPALLLLFALVAASAAASAHIGGLIVLPDFDGPTGIVVTTDQPVAFTWRDGNVDPTGVLHFRYQAANAPPTPNPDPDLLVGPEFFSVDVTDLANSYAWDLADVPSGAWYVFTETTDPPLCPGYRFAPAVVVKQAAGEPMPLGVYFFSPFRDQIITRDLAPIDLRAVGETAPTVTLTAGHLEVISDLPEPPPCDTPPCQLDCASVPREFVPVLEILSDVPMEADSDAGPGRFRLRHDWDVSGVDVGNYELRATVKTGEGESLVLYPGAGVTVRPPLTPDPGPEAAPDVAPEVVADAGGGSDEGASPDAGAGPDADSGPAVEAETADGSGCQGGGDSHGLGTLLGLLSGLLLGLSWLRTRHRPGGCGHSLGS